ncbi:hypothetical protein HanRHA438_Chr12g0557051 [Helianthus annuus]|nr:hypothetical protein HanRHA438_Chr12g0557051 [Helianthus annuus]
MAHCESSPSSSLILVSESIAHLLIFFSFDLIWRLLNNRPPPPLSLLYFVHIEFDFTFSKILMALLLTVYLIICFRRKCYFIQH